MVTRELVTKSRLSLLWAERHPPGAVDLIGGEVCLDFANSVGGSRENPVERLHRYEDLVLWAAHAGGIEEREAGALLRQSRERPDEAAAVLARGLELREAIYRIFAAIGDGESPGEADLGRLNAELEPAFARLRVAPAEDGFDYRFAADPALDRVLWPVARSAADLLVSDDLDRVKRCGGHDCDWLFLDQSKNRSRRWCDMRDCGNRAKARRHYHRRRRPAAGG